MPYRRLYELRVHLSRFDLRAASCVRVNIDMQRLQQETAEVSQQQWTRTEREIFDECVVHVESLLSESFTTINASFDNDVDLESAVGLFRTAVSARDQPYDDQLFDLLVTGADRLIDGVLGYGRHVTLHSVNTLLHVIEHVSTQAVCCLQPQVILSGDSSVLIIFNFDVFVVYDYRRSTSTTLSSVLVCHRGFRTELWITC